MVEESNPYGTTDNDVNYCILYSLCGRSNLNMKIQKIYTRFGCLNDSFLSSNNV